MIGATKFVVDEYWLQDFPSGSEADRPLDQGRIQSLIDRAQFDSSIQRVANDGYLLRRPT